MTQKIQKKSSTTFAYEVYCVVSTLRMDLLLSCVREKGPPLYGLSISIDAYLWSSSWRCYDSRVESLSSCWQPTAKLSLRKRKITYMYLTARPITNFGIFSKVKLFLSNLPPQTVWEENTGKEECSGREESLLSLRDETRGGRTRASRRTQPRLLEGSR